MATKGIESEERDWQAESDVRTLSEAEAIRNDPERMKRAAKKAKQMVKEEEAKAKGMRKIAEYDSVDKAADAMYDASESAENED